ncbi:hypothetical protein J2T57_001418 [Natronocella acetinitrilica]|uniref:Uncharacterized protein n=1 Tax=Natronocella acetinitrilica TaxID=414046 RepID=A0AAE3KB72_9GAMM|nr:hypothetical protein [Natronocella acetinitrilica]MCP1674316.1 hypothetical protein [Natronocella acetinitrilica]
MSAQATLHEQVIDALVNDLVDTLTNDRGMRYAIARQGHGGFNEMGPEGLARAFLDAGLNERAQDAPLGRVLEHLPSEAPVEALGVALKTSLLTEARRETLLREIADRLISAWDLPDGVSIKERGPALLEGGTDEPTLVATAYLEDATRVEGESRRATFRVRFAGPTGLVVDAVLLATDTGEEVGSAP